MRISWKFCFIVSVLLNVLLTIWGKVSRESYLGEKAERVRIETIRQNDHRILENLLVGKLQKKDAFANFQKTLSENDYFDKPEENGIGAGTLFFAFNKQGVLTKIEFFDFAEK